MIASWIAYLYNLLPVAIRQSRLGQLMLVLLLPAQLASEELSTYTADARLRSAATWQVQWLEKLLTDALGYAVTITEADGLPVDFRVSGIKYFDENRARALLNRYKLAGKSYKLEFSDLTIAGRWLSPVCQLTDELVYIGRWLDPACALQQELDPPDPTVLFRIYLTWAGASGASSGMSGQVRVLNSTSQVVDSKSITLYSTYEVLSFTLPEESAGYKVNFEMIGANVDGQAIQPEVEWSLNYDMSSSQNNSETPLYTGNRDIYVEVSHY